MKDCLMHSDRGALGGSCGARCSSAARRPGGARALSLGRASTEIRQGRRSCIVRQGNGDEEIIVEIDFVLNYDGHTCLIVSAEGRIKTTKMYKIKYTIYPRK